MNFTFLLFLNCLQIDKAFLELPLALNCQIRLKAWHSEFTGKEK